MWSEIFGSEFLENSYLREPASAPGEAKALTSLLTTEVFTRVAQSIPAAEVLVVQSGKLFPALLPRSLQEIKKLRDDGYSIVLRHSERMDPGLGKLAQEVQSHFLSPVAIQLYFTPQGHHSFGWHYDVEEVFIIQTAGSKEYTLRKNTVNPFPTLENMPLDMEFEKETSPLLAVTLVPGDWLYVPGGWWHNAEALSDSLSLSIGVMVENKPGRLGKS